MIARLRVEQVVTRKWWLCVRWLMMRRPPEDVAAGKSEWHTPWVLHSIASARAFR
jgi:hypothetical protein